MPTTRGAAKRDLDSKRTASAAKAKKVKQDAAPAASRSLTRTRTLSDEQRKHESKLLKAGLIYEKADWTQLEALVNREFSPNAGQLGLGRLEIPFNFNVRKSAATIPSAVVQTLAPLTNLTRLEFSGWANHMSDTNPIPKEGALPYLKVADFDHFSTSAGCIARFAPNLLQLKISRVDINAGPDNPHPKLARCTHLAATDLFVLYPSSALATAQAVAAAFPVLKVLSEAPEVTGFPGNEGTHTISSSRYHVYDYMRHLQGLVAVRRTTHDAIWGRYALTQHPVAAARPGLLALQGLQGLRTLNLMGLTQPDLAVLTQVSQLQQLTRFAFSMGNRTVSSRLHAVLQSLAQLPQLQCLALPSQVLCTEGCCPPGMKQTLHSLAVRPSLKKLVFLNTDFNCFNGPYPAQPDASVKTCGHKLGCAEAVQSLRVAADRQRQQQQEEEEEQQAGSRVEVVLLDLDDERYLSCWTSSSTYDWGHTIWGVFGPCERNHVPIEW